MSSQRELAVSYGVSNDFFKLWLDKKMNYSCALFLSPDDSLEQAQINKLSFFYDKTRLNKDSRVLDIGCGWGGNLSYLAEDRGLADVTGITLAVDQHEYLQQNPIRGAHIECISYTDYRPKSPVDAIISIGMFEHIVTPQQVRNGTQIDVYRDYFRRAWEWTKPGAYFGLQAVIGRKIPRDRKVLRDLAWITTDIFPGAISPRIEAVAAGVTPYWEIVELHTRREHYARTAHEWLKRLQQNQSIIQKQWGQATYRDYERYLGSCVELFSGGFQSLAQFVLKRID